MYVPTREVQILSTTDQVKQDEGKYQQMLYSQSWCGYLVTGLVDFRILVLWIKLI